MRRREFIKLLPGTAAAWSLAARAQPAPLPVIGFLNAGSYSPRAHLVAAFRIGLAESGYVEGQSVLIEYRWAEDSFDRLPALATDLVKRKVLAIAAPGGTPAPLATKAVTSSIPIIFSVGEDPVRLGLVDSLSRPGGNVTGVSYFTNELTAKRLGILRELISGPIRVALLINPKGPYSDAAAKDAAVASAATGLPLDIFHASSNQEIDASFARIVQNRCGALLVYPDPLFTSRHAQLITLSISNRIPAMFTSREFATAGGLLSYGANLKEVYRQVGVYTGRVLRGERPADLPVIQPTKFELIINLTTAKALGLTIPQSLLVAADEVIE